MYLNLAILAAFVFLYSIVSGRMDRTVFNGAILFTTFGLIIGPLGFGSLSLSVDAEGLRTLAELTLALVLFTDASNANLRELKRSFHIPQRLLLLGLPLTILLGFGAGVLMFDGLTLLEIAIIATMLAPTDAALGKAVVTNESVPDNIREGLNVESGLNDGICVPILLIFLALATSTGTEGSASMLAFKLVVEAIGIGVAAGAGLTLLGVLLLRKFAELGWVTETWRQLCVPALAVEISKAQYENGLVDYNTVITTLKSDEQQQDIYASTKGAVATNLIQVYKSLGGGWEIRAGQDPVELLPAATKQEMRDRTPAWKGVLQ